MTIQLMQMWQQWTAPFQSLHLPPGLLGYVAAQIKLAWAWFAGLVCLAVAWLLSENRVIVWR